MSQTDYRQARRVLLSREASSTPIDASRSVGTAGISGANLPFIVVGVLAAVAVRVILLPTDGLRGDIDEFVVWVNHIANNGLPNAYDEDLSFGPVMAYIWGILGFACLFYLGDG